MKFPVTREYLQYTTPMKEQADKDEEELKKQLDLKIQEFCKNFKQYIINDLHEKKYVHRFNCLNDIINNSRVNHTRDIISRYINLINEQFIGCDIIVDPLQTYIIIDWS